MGVTPEFILMVYLNKHLDGITAHINGHTSQREDVRGRIADAMVYLALLWGLEEIRNPSLALQINGIGENHD